MEMCELRESHRLSGILLCMLAIVSTADSSLSRNHLTPGLGKSQDHQQNYCNSIDDG